MVGVGVPHRVGHSKGMGIGEDGMQIVVQCRKWKPRHLISSCPSFSPFRQASAHDIVVFVRHRAYQCESTNVWRIYATGKKKRETLYQPSHTSPPARGTAIAIFLRLKTRRGQAINKYTRCLATRKIECRERRKEPSAQRAGWGPGPSRLPPWERGQRRAPCLPCAEVDLGSGSCFANKTECPQPLAQTTVKTPQLSWRDEDHRFTQ